MTKLNYEKRNYIVKNIEDGLSIGYIAEKDRKNNGEIRRYNSLIYIDNYLTRKYNATINDC